MHPQGSQRETPPAPDQGGGVLCGRNAAGQTAGGQARQIMDGDDIRRALTRIAHEIVERNKGAGNLALIGVHTRGVPVARRLGALIERFEGCRVPVGELDIAAHRDDRRPARGNSRTRIDFDIAGKIVVLVDEVLYTGRTCRAAMDALVEYGRPARVQLAVLVDRGHRELPIRADYVGRNIPTSRQERVSVRLSDTDGEEAVVIERLLEDAL